MTSDQVRKALIPAAGRGTRFLPVTKSVPKELLPIVSTPALEFVVTEAAQNGLNDVLLVVGPDKQGVAQYFAPAPDLEEALRAKGDEAGLVRIKHAEGLARIQEVEQTVPRGLGDAVGLGEQFAEGEPIAVLLPDDLIDDRDDLLGRMLDVYRRFGGIVLGLIEVPREEIRKYGSVAVNFTNEVDVVAIHDLVEKPDPTSAPSNLAVIGRYVLPPQIFAAIKQTTPGYGGEIQVTDAMKQLVASGTPAHGVIFRGRRHDTGDRLDYLRAVVQLAIRHPDVGAEFQSWLRDYVGKDFDGSR